MLDPTIALLETAFRLVSIPPHDDWGYEQHLLANTSGVSRHAGMGLYIGVDILDASPDNAFLLTTYEEQILGAVESRTDDNDFTYAHTIPEGRVVLGGTTTSWGPWTNHTWDRRRVNCVLWWNAKLQQIVLCVTAPKRAGDEFPNFYGRGYWMAILHTLP